MKKVLFVSSFMLQESTGAAVASTRNLRFCKAVFKGFEVDAFAFSFADKEYGSEVQPLVSYRSKWQTLTSYLFGYCGGLTAGNTKQLVALCKEHAYSHVFLDGSLLGSLAERIKTILPDITIIIFYHNIEHDFFKAAARQKKYYLPLYWQAAAAERKAAVNAGYSLVFNQRDADRLKELYHLDADAVIPITMPDEFNEERSAAILPKAKDLLFVGSNFFPNVEGVRWFCREVMPHVGVNLIIAGKGMELFREEWQNEKVQVVGTVDDLHRLYYQARMVVAPIFSGSGMKIKTAEALMMGKTVLGTDEAWQGYELEPSVNGFRCNTSAEFIETIHALANRDIAFNKAARETYLRQHSDTSLQEKISGFRNLLQLNEA